MRNFNNIANFPPVRCTSLNINVLTSSFLDKIGNAETISFQYDFLVLVFIFVFISINQCFKLSSIQTLNIRIRENSKQTK